MSGVSAWSFEEGLMFLGLPVRYMVYWGDLCWSTWGDCDIVAEPAESEPEFGAERAADQVLAGLVTIWPTKASELTFYKHHLKLLLSPSLPQHTRGRGKCNPNFIRCQTY